MYKQLLGCIFLFIALMFPNIVQSKLNFQMSEQNKKAIRENIRNLRLSIKQKCTEENQAGLSVWKTKNVEEEAPRTRRRRKTSENLKSFETLSVFQDQSITQSFDQCFELQKKLGEGVQSVVYRCRQFGSNQVYAVKVVKQRDLQLMYNMRHCYQILRELDHQSIIQGKYLYMNQKKLTCHMVMEMVQFPDLRHFINQKKQHGENISETTVANITKSLLECLIYMSSKGVCHRDIKPDNILYDPVTGRLKLIDFQTARMQRYSHQKLQLWSCTGTPSYRAPQTYSKGYGMPVDTWAVGMIAFQMLTGQLPFKTKYVASMAKKICSKDIDYDEYNLSPSAKAFLKKLLDKNPETRIIPKDAIIHPFILKNTQYSVQKSLSKRKSYKAEEDRDSDDTDNNTPTRYYEDHMHFSLCQNLCKDIGVRFCEE